MNQVWQSRPHDWKGECPGQIKAHPEKKGGQMVPTKGRDGLVWLDTVSSPERGVSLVVFFFVPALFKQLHCEVKP